MQTKLAAVLAREAAGQTVDVSQLCRNLGISRQTYYKYRRRFEAEGLTGLAPRSRRPLHSPTRVGPVIEDAIVRARTELAEEGWDAGAISIRARLLSEGVAGVPSVRTIHRLLLRLDLVIAQARKRPHSALRRFEFPAVDDCWQIDAFEHVLGDRTKVVVFQLLDDHSRYELATLAWPSEDGAGAWACVSGAIERYGRPRMLLSDNGLAFSGARRGRQVTFEHNLRRIGIPPITSRPYHPQTCGKNERAHQTIQRWLAARTLAANLTELQTQLDTYRNAYNHHRPHQALAGSTPAQRRATGTRTEPPPRPSTPHPPSTTTTTAGRTGKIATAGTIIGLGSEHADLPVTVIHDNGHVLVFYRDTLIRELDIDPNRDYQPLHRTRSGTRLTRISDTVT